MRRIILATTIALSLGGCAQLDTLRTIGDLSTKSIQNPVTKDDLYRIEAGLTLAVTALATYKKACSEGLADSRCYENIAAVQVYTRQAKPYLMQLSSFVRRNDQVNAVVVYNQLSGILANIRAEAANRGIKTGA